MQATYDDARDAIGGDFQQFGYDANGGFVARLDPNSDTPFTFENFNATFNRPIAAYHATLFDNFDEIQSFFVRANYTYADKFLFTGTFRADGSTLFGRG